MSSEYALRISDNLAFFIRKLHPQLKRKVRVVLTDILANPSCGKALKLELNGLWTYRVGRHRIIYRWGEGKVVDLVAVGPRSTIYEETYRLLMKNTQQEESPWK